MPKTKSEDAKIDFRGNPPFCRQFPSLYVIPQRYKKWPSQIGSRTNSWAITWLWCFAAKFHKFFGFVANLWQFHLKNCCKLWQILAKKKIAQIFRSQINHTHLKRGWPIKVKSFPPTAKTCHRMKKNIQTVIETKWMSVTHKMWSNKDVFGNWFKWR